MNPDDPHRLAERRSAAYHAVVAERLRWKPEILADARERVERWCRAEPVPFYARQWQRVLSSSEDEICRFLAEDSEFARELRQSSPFAGALTARERWEIWYRVAGRPRTLRHDAC